MKPLLALFALTFSLHAEALPLTRVLIQGQTIVRLVNSNGTVNDFSRFWIIPGSKEVAELLLSRGSNQLSICDVEMFDTRFNDESVATVFSIENCNPYEWPRRE